MSATDDRTGAGARTSERFVSFVSVKTPAEPPSKVHVPTWSGGIISAPWIARFGLLGKFELPSMIGFVKSKVGFPVLWPKPLRSITEIPACSPPRAM